MMQNDYCSKFRALNSLKFPRTSAKFIENLGMIIFLFPMYPFLFQPPMCVLTIARSTRGELVMNTHLFLVGLEFFWLPPICKCLFPHTDGNPWKGCLFKQSEKYSIFRQSGLILNIFALNLKKFYYVFLDLVCLCYIFGSDIWHP